MARFLLDEDVQLSLTKVLVDAGHDAVHVLQSNLRGSADDEVLQAAVADARILITADLGMAVIEPGVVRIRRTRE